MCGIKSSPTKGYLNFFTFFKYFCSKLSKTFLYQVKTPLKIIFEYFFFLHLVEFLKLVYGILEKCHHKKLRPFAVNSIFSLILSCSNLSITLSLFEK